MIINLYFAIKEKNNNYTYFVIFLRYLLINYVMNCNSFGRSASAVRQQKHSSASSTRIIIMRTFWNCMRLKLQNGRNTTKKISKSISSGKNMSNKCIKKTVSIVSHKKMIIFSILLKRITFSV